MSKAQLVLPGAQRTSPVRHLHQIELARRWNISPRTLENWRWLGHPPEAGEPPPVPLWTRQGHSVRAFPEGIPGANVPSSPRRDPC